MNGEMHHLTPTQIKAHERSKAFRAHIDTLAQKLKAGPEAPVPKIVFNREPKPERVAPELQPAPTPVTPREKFWFHIEEQRGCPSIARIQEAVCDYFKLSLTDLVSARRDWGVVRPRQIGMYLAKKLTLRSLPEIGRRFGGRDHTTVLAGIRRIEKVMQYDPKMKTAFREIGSNLGGVLD